MKIINLTPHVINVITENGEIVIQPSGVVARIEETILGVGGCNGIRVFYKRYSTVVGLPEPKDGVRYIVSLPVAKALAGKRKDLFAIGNPVRDAHQRVVGCRSLVICEP